MVPSSSPSSPLVPPSSPSSPLALSSSPSSPLAPSSSPSSPLIPSSSALSKRPRDLALPEQPLASAPPELPQASASSEHPPIGPRSPQICQGHPSPQSYHGRLNSLPQSLRPYMFSLSLVSQYLLGPSLLPWVYARRGGLLSCLLHTGGLRSRLLRPGGLRSCLLRLGTLLCWLWLGSWSRHFHIDLALRPSPDSTSAPPPSWIVLCLECLEAAPWGGLCHESCPCTPCYSPPEVTHLPHGLLHHTNGCTSPKTTFSITHCTDVTQLIALSTLYIALDFLSVIEYCIAYILAIATLQSPLHCYSLACFLVCWYLLVYLDSLSALPCWILYADRKPTLALDYSLPCHIQYIPVCQCVTHACFQPCLLIKPCRWIRTPHVLFAP